MTTPTEPGHPGAGATTSGAGASARPAVITRIAVGVDGYPEGRDAVVLGAAIARATEAELMLVSVYSAPLFPAPPELSSTSLRKEAEASLFRVREASAPTARIVVESDSSIARALHRIVHRDHRDLLVLGSSRQGSEGHVRIGKRTRQLLCHFECPLAIAPRGIHGGPELELRRIGVGYDGEEESEAALALAASIASTSGAELDVRAVVDDRVPLLLRSAVSGLASTEWSDGLEAAEKDLHARAVAAAQAAGATATVDVLRGRPANALLELSGKVDLLVVGSRRWGPTARLVLGSTGEALMHDASCAVLAVPRPES